MVEPMTEEELQAFTERLCDALPNKMEIVGYSWSRRWDAYRVIIPAVVKALGMVRPAEPQMTPGERAAFEAGRHFNCTESRCFNGHVRFCPKPKA